MDSIVLPQVVLHFAQGHAILVHVDGTHDDIRFVAHSFETIGRDKSSTTNIASEQLFRLFFVMSFSTLNNIIRSTIWT